MVSKYTHQRVSTQLEHRMRQDTTVNEDLVFFPSYQSAEQWLHHQSKRMMLSVHGTELKPESEHEDKSRGMRESIYTIRIQDDQKRKSTTDSRLGESIPDGF
jgi:hypothetical protein